MAIDQRDVSSKLRFMDDRALQQYAAMHKSDPYIFPLAFQESQNRQKLRMQQQGAQGMQPQPKVADQALAQMAPPQAQPMPETQGIGALPAPNMQGMADGGIAGYEGYGEEPQQFGQESVLRMAEGGIARYQAGGNIQSKYQQEAQEMGMGTRTQYSPDVQAFVQEQAQASRAEEQAYVKQEQQRMLRGPYGDIAPTKPAAAVPPKVTPTYSRDDYSGMDRRIMSGSQLPSIQSITPPTKAAPAEERVAAPRADTGRASSAPTGIAAAAAAKDDPFSMSSIKKAQDEAMGDSKYQIGALNNQLVGIRNRAETQMQQRLDERKKEITEEGDVYKDRSDRLVERAKGLAAQKNENQGLALLNAGLAIMSTPGSLASAIGKGAQVGTAQYAAGIKDLRAAQERLDEANERISELRLNRKDLNSREIRALEKERDAAIRDGEKMVFDFAKDVYGMDRKKADATFTSYMSGQEKKAEITSRENIAANQERGANARAGALPGEARAAMLLGTGKTDAERFESGMAKYKELTGDKQGTQLLKLFLEENGRREKNAERPLTLDQFRRQASAFYAPPAAVDTGKPDRS